MRNAKGFAVRFLGGSCGLLGDSCGRPEPPRRDADEPLEVTAELALVREAGARGDLRQGEVAALQELLGPLDAAGDDILVRRQPGGPLELLREVVGGIQTPINSLVGAIVQGIRARGPEISARQNGGCLATTHKTVGVWQPSVCYGKAE
jgi:hypothetical protein